MKQGNISIFIPHNGCPHQCSFCNQKNITGQATQPDAEYVKNTLRKAVGDLGENSSNYEIAFFGGSFTAIDRDYMISLLDATKPFINEFKGIRVSTRPDSVDDEKLKLLLQYGVTSIELGAQSMDNSVLELNKRGHSALDVENASRLIKSYGYSLGLQMMTGLYGSDFEKDIETANRFIELKPDTVRIYPTVIMNGTDLADYYQNGSYKPNTLEQSVSLCARLILMFAKADIKIIRLGLHYSDSLVKNSIGNNYHPAFKELCENEIFLSSFLEQARELPTKKLNVFINEKSLSKFLGQKKCNINKLNDLGYDITVNFDNTLDKYGLGVRKCD